MPGSKKVVYRDSKSGEFIKKSTADKKNPATWEKQHIPKK